VYIGKSLCKMKYSCFVQMFNMPYSFLLARAEAWGLVWGIEECLSCVWMFSLTRSWCSAIITLNVYLNIEFNINSFTTRIGSLNSGRHTDYTKTGLYLSTHAIYVIWRVYLKCSENTSGVSSHHIKVRENFILIICPRALSRAGGTEFKFYVYVSVHIKYISKITQKHATFLDVFISINCFTCFRQFHRPLSGAQNCTYSVRYCQTNTAACCSSIGLTIPDAVCSFVLLIMGTGTAWNM
jgi:hypothetical protein